MDGQHIKNSPYDLQVRKSKLDYSAGLGNPQLDVRVTSPLCIAIHKKSGDILLGVKPTVSTSISRIVLRKPPLALQEMVFVSSIDHVDWTSKEMSCM